MNEITRKAANALIAAVDFFQGALAAEAQAGDAKQVQLDALAAQLKAAKEDREILDLRQKNFDLECQKARLVAEEDDLILERNNLRSENGALREVAMRARALLHLKPGTKAYEKAREFLARDIKALDG